MLILLGVVILLVAGGLLLFMRPVAPPAPIEDESAQVRNVVTQFGLRLKAVSLLLPKEQLTALVEQQYGDFVTPELLAAWKQDPTKAPGRLTSSPWPERIEITAVNKGQGERYTVTGNIIEITSTEANTGGAANKMPVTMVVEKRQNRWLIASFASAQPQPTFSKQGIITKDTPGLKPNVWYLTYEEPGKPALRKELNTSGVNLTGKYLYNGQTARVEGTESGDTVTVSKLDIVNASKGDLIWVASPLPGQVISSPLTVAGQARGNWFFEASFPVKLLDANGNVIVQKPAQAQGEWMTTNYVPFSVSLTFQKPATATGTLVLEKDNPSGLPENANELRIPVKFQ